MTARKSVSPLEFSIFPPRTVAYTEYMQSQTGPLDPAVSAATALKLAVAVSVPLAQHRLPERRIQVLLSILRRGRVGKPRVGRAGVSTHQFRDAAATLSIASAFQ